MVLRESIDSFITANEKIERKWEVRRLCGVTLLLFSAKSLISKLQAVFFIFERGVDLPGIGD
jgi:hypothetical protein